MYVLCVLKTVHVAVCVLTLPTPSKVYGFRCFNHFQLRTFVSKRQNVHPNCHHRTQVYWWQLVMYVCIYVSKFLNTLVSRVTLRYTYVPFSSSTYSPSSPYYHCCHQWCGGGRCHSDPPPHPGCLYHCLSLHETQGHKWVTELGGMGRMRGGNGVVVMCYLPYLPAP